MSLREATKKRHHEAESTAFMKLLFKGNLPPVMWASFLASKYLFYTTIENRAREEGFLEGLEEICRASLLGQDLNELSQQKNICPFVIPKSAFEYQKYILSLTDYKIMAHIYTWHMGDLSGGQIIKKIVPGPHRNLEFNNPDALKELLKSRLSDELADEANTAFMWAIKIMNECYDSNDFSTVR